MTNLKTKLAELLSPMGAGNNAYELGQLAQQQSALIDVLVGAVISCKWFGGEREYDEQLVEGALQKAKDAGYL